MISWFVKLSFGGAFTYVRRDNTDLWVWSCRVLETDTVLGKPTKNFPNWPWTPPKAHSIFRWLDNAPGAVIQWFVRLAVGGPWVPVERKNLKFWAHWYRMPKGVNHVYQDKKQTFPTWPWTPKRRRRKKTAIAIGN